MSFITWDQNLRVNVVEIDAQHKKLVDLLNKLFDEVKSGNGRTAMDGVLTELVNYTEYHFDTEERLLEKYGYPAYAEHKKQHEDLKKEVQDLKTDFHKGQAAITFRTMSFLSEWLKRHIMGEDKKYGLFLNSKGVML